MSKKEIKVKIAERFKNENIDKRKETLDEIFYKIIKAKEITSTEADYKLYLGSWQKRCIIK